MMSNDNEKAWQHYIRALALPAGDSRARSTKEIASVRRGLTAGTEVYAYPFVLPHVPADASRQTEQALLRGASLVAEFKDSIPAFTPSADSDGRYPRRSFGQWAGMVAHNNRELLDPNSPGMIGNRLAYIHTQSLDEAAMTIRRILLVASRGSERAPAIDYVDLVATLVYWGRGLTQASRERRLRIIRDFYRPQRQEPADPTTTSQAQN
ncbi:type I-E CRISPR-associated protein Cse2/CasB [Trueperella bernardiae]|nr:type I-E CRISPR-associated protein Cse2/CasB [Trueperella bernardiae]